MSERIQTAYQFTGKELNIIKLNFITFSDWEKSVFSSIKKKLIEHLRVEQDNECCYCKKELGFDIKDVDIEHIVPKSEYERFTFNNKNLALSCPACNTKKSTKQVLNGNCNKYPRSKNAFIINHAHYDNYSENISILEDCIYVANSTKGCNTISCCELFRYQLVEENAKKYYSKKSPLSILTERIRNASESDANDFLDVIKDILKK